MIMYTRVRVQLAVLTALALLIAAEVPADDYEGIGYGKTVAEARAQALADLAGRLEIRIASTTDATRSSSRQGNRETYESSIRNDVRTKVDLTLLGHELGEPEFVAGGEYMVRAVLSAARAIPRYEIRRADLRREIESLVRVSDSADRVGRERSLSAQLAAVLEYEKLTNALAALGVRDLGAPPLDRASVEEALRASLAAMDTLERGAAALAKGIAGKRVYVFPPAAPGSGEITPFAAALRARLGAEVNSIDRPEAAEAFLKGTYQPGAEGIDVSYSLISAVGSESGRVLASAAVRLLPESYRGIRWQPLSLDLDALIAEGGIVSDDFAADITSSRGKRDLLFQRGEEAEFFVKLNRSGYFYVVSHSDLGGESFSYLLELEPSAQGARKFVRFVGPDEANRWISLGRFRVEEPFGVERLQVFASTADAAERLPPWTLDPRGYYRLSLARSERVSATRGFIKKVSSGDRNAEASLTATTVE